MTNLLIGKNYKFISFFVLLCLGNFFFWGNTAWSIGGSIFSLLLLTGILPKEWKSDKWRDAIIILFVLNIVVALSFLYQVNWINITLMIILLIMYRLTIDFEFSTFVETWANLFKAVIKAFFAEIWIFFKVEKSEKSESISSKVIRQIALWIVPVIISIVFILIFGMINPIFEQKLKVYYDWILKWELPEPSQVFFWLILAMFLALIINMSLVVKFAINARYKIEIFDDKQFFEKNSDFLLSIMVRGLVLFNIIFAIHNILDIEYLWINLHLPEGMSFATYAHRGAYPLIVVAFMSGLIVMLTFQKRIATFKYKLAEILVFIWLGQNIFLIFSAILRLQKYVNVYNLTILRLSAFLWMVVVGIGILLLIYRIISNKSNRFLINLNIIVVFLVLLSCCFWDMNRVIALYNVRHCQERTQNIENAKLDMEYLFSLGTSALPAIEEAEKFIKFSNSRLIEKNQLEEQLESNLANWRSWSLKEYYIADFKK